MIIIDMKLPNTCTMCWQSGTCDAYINETDRSKTFDTRLENCPMKELVLCKDCKWSEKFDGGKGSEGKLICNSLGDVTDADGYCHCGERRKQ